MKVFEPFRLDTSNHCLWRAEERMSLTPKAFDVLRYLVEHSNRLVTQDEILERLWPETYVNPEGIRKYILEIRKVLGDRRNQPSFIETLPKRGYRFIAQVTDERILHTNSAADATAANMVGRDAALADLNSHFEPAMSGQRHLVFVTGEAGMGKTTLIDAFLQQVIHSPGLRIARGQCIEGFGGEEAYYPILEALGSLVLKAEDGSSVQMLAKHAPTWLAQFPSLVKAEQGESLQREILGSTRGRMVRELCEALEAMTAVTPLVVVLEDLHWADPSTLDLISAFARRREAAKLLLIGTYRPADMVLSQSPLKALKQDLQVRDLCHEIAIERLKETDVADYLANVFVDNYFPSGLARLIHHNSGGNALFMVAIVRDIVKQGLIVQDGAAWTLAAPLPDVYPGIPETLQQLLESQFEQMSSEEQRILQSASVAGERFPVWAPAVMLGVSPESIEEACERLAEKQQFIRFAGFHAATNGADCAHYEFRHALFRQALYGRLSNLNRSKLHRCLAEELLRAYNAGKRELASELALHFEEGRDYEQAARCLLITAENAARRFSYRDSVRVLEHALRLTAGLEPEIQQELEIQIRRRTGEAQYALGEMSASAESYAALAELAAKAGLKTLHVSSLVNLALPLWYIDPERGNRACQQALEMGKTLSDPVIVAQTKLTAVSLRLLYDTWSEEDAEICVQARETIRGISGSFPPDVHYAYVEAIQGNYQEADQYADILISTTTNPTKHVLAFGAKGIVLLSRGRFGELLEIVSTGRRMAERDGEDPWMYIFGEAWLRMLCADFEGVQRLSEIVMRSDAEPHAHWMRAALRVSNGFAELHRANFGEALQYFGQVLDYRTTPRFFLHWYWRMMAQAGTADARLYSGDLESARRDGDAFLASALSAAEPSFRARAWEVNSRIARAERDDRNARKCIDQALAILDEFEIPMAAWQVHRTAGDLCADEGDLQKATEHRVLAKEFILKIADSFQPGEPLRESFLAAAPVRRILEQRASA